MCELCSGDVETKRNAIVSHNNFANRLRELADAYEAMAAGKVKMHDSDSQIGVIGYNAKEVLKRLANDWV